VWGNISTGCTSCVLNHCSFTNNSISLAIVTGLHEMYNNLNLYSFLNFQIHSITLGCNHSRGGSTTTTPIFLIFSSNSGNFVKTFSHGDATKKLWLSNQFILALTLASFIASSTISIHISSIFLFLL
jgi:hypothetical protein